MYFWAGNGTWGSAPTMCWSLGRDSQPSNQSQSQKVKSQAVLIESKLRLAFDFDEIRPGHPGCGIWEMWWPRLGESWTMGHMSTNHTLGVCMYASNPLRVFLASQDAPLISSALETLPETQLRELRPPIEPGPKIIILQGRFRPQKILCVAVSNDEKKMSCLFLSVQNCETKIPDYGWLIWHWDRFHVTKFLGILQLELIFGRIFHCRKNFPQIWGSSLVSWRASTGGSSVDWVDKGQRDGLFHGFWKSSLLTIGVSWCI